jgi:hypothetical protein
MNSTTTEYLIKALTKRFPKAWFKEGGEFSTSGEFDTAVWSGEGSYLNNDVQMFNYYSESSNYIFGTHKQLTDFVERHGYYVECYDAGTFFIFPN